MIVAKTKMEHMPENCKKCSIRETRFFKELGHTEGVCGAKHRICPREKKESGNVGYAMPSWCPLMDIYFPEDE